LKQRICDMAVYVCTHAGKMYMLTFPIRLKKITSIIYPVLKVFDIELDTIAIQSIQGVTVKLKNRL